jgi:hypothetical protein
MCLRSTLGVALLGLTLAGSPAFAQATPDPQTHQHPTTSSSGQWQLNQDGVVYGLFNRQGGPRGGSEFVVPNWWMGVWTREHGPHQFGINAMLSLDPATVGGRGYRELFQVGEAYEGEPLVDRQHPHDLLMQLATTWRRSVGDASVMFSGGLAGEPTLGPVAFMHRPSAAELPMAPLGHHTFDSTHISFGVVTASLERGRWTLEGSAFNGREPDDERWDLDLGPLDSFAGRVWFRPTGNLALQVSSGRLSEPEELVPGDAVRSTISGSWFRSRSEGFDAVTAGYGVTSAHDELRHGTFGEVTTTRRTMALSARLELQQVETELLISGGAPHDADPAGHAPSNVFALTFSGSHRLFTWRGFEGAVGAGFTAYRVPDALRATHGEHPLSFQVFARVRLPAGPMGRMWNMVMSQGHRMEEMSTTAR